MKRHRIYYVPGIISLLFLPIICYMYLKPYNQKERIIEIVLPDKYDPNTNYYEGLRFDTTVLSSPGYRRKYSDFELNGDFQHDNLILDSFKKEMQILINTEDTINGLHIIYGNDVKYETFIKSINICFKDTFARFITYDNHLWYLYKETDEELKERV